MPQYFFVNNSKHSASKKRFEKKKNQNSSKKIFQLNSNHEGIPNRSENLFEETMINPYGNSSTKRPLNKEIKEKISSESNFSKIYSEPFSMKEKQEKMAINGHNKDKGVANLFTFEDETRNGKFDDLKPYLQKYDYTEKFETFSHEEHQKKNFNTSDKYSNFQSFMPIQYNQTQEPQPTSLNIYNITPLYKVETVEISPQYTKPSIEIPSHPLQNPIKSIESLYKFENKPVSYISNENSLNNHTYKPEKIDNYNEINPIETKAKELSKQKRFLPNPFMGLPKNFENISKPETPRCLYLNKGKMTPKSNPLAAFSFKTSESKDFTTSESNEKSTFPSVLYKEVLFSNEKKIDSSNIQLSSIPINPHQSTSIPINPHLLSIPINTHETPLKYNCPSYNAQTDAFYVKTFIKKPLPPLFINKTSLNNNEIMKKPFEKYNENQDNLKREDEKIFNEVLDLLKKSKYNTEPSFSQDKNNIIEETPLFKEKTIGNNGKFAKNDEICNEKIECEIGSKSEITEEIAENLQNLTFDEEILKIAKIEENPLKIQKDSKKSLKTRNSLNLFRNSKVKNLEIEKINDELKEIKPKQKSNSNIEENSKEKLEKKPKSMSDFHKIMRKSIEESNEISENSIILIHRKSTKKQSFDAEKLIIFEEANFSFEGEESLSEIQEEERELGKKQMKFQFKRRETGGFYKKLKEKIIKNKGNIVKNEKSEKKKNQRKKEQMRFVKKWRIKRKKTKEKTIFLC